LIKIKGGAVLKKLFLLGLISILLCSSIALAATEYSSGRYLDYRYTYTYKEGQYIFMFSPKYLPRDDGTVIGAMYQAIKDVNGKLDLIDTNPKIKRNSKGVGIIYFIGKKCFYNFLLMKNDDGTSYGFSLWMEPK
jgi:hypothetical protein